MHHTTRRLKRFRRQVSFPDQLTRPNGDLSPIQVLNEDSSSSLQNRRIGYLQLDPLRGAVLVAIIMVTIVLYVALWELERASFVVVPKVDFNPNQNKTAISQVAVNPGRMLEKYPIAVIHHSDLDASIPRPTERPDNRPADSSPADDTDPLSSKAATWPPPITRVPDEHPEKFKEEIARFRTSNPLPDFFDVAYCGGTCRFLLPIRIGEQESKARLHFAQLLKLAQRLNRTLVLPNVGKSRMSVCSQWPFEAYYDTNAFANDSPSRPATTNLTSFTKWIDERAEIPASVFVSMDSTTKDHQHALESLALGANLPFVVQDLRINSKSSTCLEARLPRLHSSIPAEGLSISFSSGSQALKGYQNASDQLIALLSGRLDVHATSDFDMMTGPAYEYPNPFTETPNTWAASLANANVLIVDYDLRYPLFAPSGSDAHFNLHYASGLYDLADRISDNLVLFVGVHWRMENVPVENLAWCAASLVSKLHRLLQDEVLGKDIRHVWLATDYPLPLASHPNDGRAISRGRQRQNGKNIPPERPPVLLNRGPPKKSSTFKRSSPEHEDAMEMFTEAFQPGGDLDAWPLTDLSEQLRWYPYVEGKFDIDEALLDDSGVFGILDKLVVVQSQVFVSGSPECSKVSSFSKQVVEARRESFEARRGRDSIRNVVEYFGR